jgi:hypothetical protein
LYFSYYIILLLKKRQNSQGKYLESNQEPAKPQIATLPIELYLPYYTGEINNKLSRQYNDEIQVSINLFFSKSDSNTHCKYQKFMTYPLVDSRLINSIIKKNIIIKSSIKIINDYNNLRRLLFIFFSKHSLQLF